MHYQGDSYASNGMVQFMDIIRQLYPSIFVHSIYVAKDQDDDQKAGWVRRQRIASLDSY